MARFSKTLKPCKSVQNKRSLEIENKTYCVKYVQDYSFLNCIWRWLLNTQTTELFGLVK